MSRCSCPKLDAEALGVSPLFRFTPALSHLSDTGGINSKALPTNDWCCKLWAPKWSAGLRLRHGAPERRAGPKHLSLEPESPASRFLSRSQGKEAPSFQVSALVQLIKPVEMQRDPPGSVVESNLKPHRNLGGMSRSPFSP